MRITDFLALFQKTKNPFYLVKALFRIIRQGRFYEVLWSLFCLSCYSPSTVSSKISDEKLIEEAFKQIRPTYRYEAIKNRIQLIDMFGDNYRISELPIDFECARTASIVCEANFLLIGEYGHSARIAYVTRDACFLINYYNETPKIDHIHLIHKIENCKSFLIATGDGQKVLDHWEMDRDGIRFVERIRGHFAGYTAAICVQGVIFLGTDFSERPNYIETLQGEKYFFPKIAYKMWVLGFKEIRQRYIISLNAENQSPWRMAISLFDVRRREFIYCDYFSEL